MRNNTELVEKISDTICNEQLAIAEAVEAWNRKVDALNGMATDEQAKELLMEFNMIKRRDNNINRLIDALDKLINTSIEKDRDKAFKEFKTSLGNIVERKIFTDEKVS